MNTVINLPSNNLLKIIKQAHLKSKKHHKQGKFVYPFGNGKADGNAGMRDLLGGKGAGLAEMSAIGLPVPPGFTITTEVCTFFNKNSGQYPSGLDADVAKALSTVEKLTGARFGNARRPLLVSVRSGARASMPGMMDTVLNLGLNDATVGGLATQSGDPRFAYDSYRRFIQMFADVVMGIDHHHFEDILQRHKTVCGLSLDTDLSATDWQDVIMEYKMKIREEAGKDFPQDPHMQLWDAIAAVFRSWSNARAVTYRKLHNISHDWGTAVNVQAMVFGNMGDDSATGVAFSRDPATGENTLYGEYLVNAQGEDVVAGIRTPQQITVAGKISHRSKLPAMEEVMPEVFQELNTVRHTLEKHYGDMQDIEFTVQRGKLYMLQTRVGKRTARAAMKIACDMVDEGVITKDQAVMRVDPKSLNQLLHPMLDPKAERRVIARGLPASPGAASGYIVFSADEAERLAHLGEKVILCRVETSPEDIHGMHAAAGIITTRGGMTSHAAVVARGMGRPCVAGASEISIDYETRKMNVRGVELSEGDTVTLDGGSGELMSGCVPTIEPELPGDFTRLMGWADERRKLGVLANADTPSDCRKALQLGAEGVGLCRTEHMFFDAGRIIAVREMILADTQEGRKKALEKVLPMQREDFAEIFRIMHGRPVTIRLLDPPLHEFLPHGEAEMNEVADAAGVDVEMVRERSPLRTVSYESTAPLPPQLHARETRTVSHIRMTTPTPESNSSDLLTTSSSSIVKSQIAALQALQSLLPSDQAPLLPITIEKAVPLPPIANSAPLGLLGFALVSILAAVPKLENRSPTDGLLFVVALFLGGIAQVLAAVLQYYINNLHGATTFALFGLHWSAQSILLFARDNNELTFSKSPDSSEAAVYYATITTATIMLWVASFKKNRVLCSALFFVIFAFGFDVPAAFGHRWAEVGSAIAAIAASLIALYMAFVDVVNEAWGTQLLSVFPVQQPQLDSK